MEDSALGRPARRDRLTARGSAAGRWALGLDHPALLGRQHVGELLLVVLGGDEEQFVAGLQRAVGVRRPGVAVTDDRDQHDVARPGESPIRLPAHGLLAGRVISTRLASPSWKVSSRTRSPTVTASSTSADISRGVETATSTPQTSLNSHSFLGWLTRPTVRGTPNSVLASSDMTRLALSSPVAAIATSQVSSPASSSEESSQASASSHSASRQRCSDLIARGSWSISRTS